MKLLKLDARHNDARKIANCLIGNIACDPKDPYGFHGKFYASNGFDTFYTEDGYGKPYSSSHTIYFLADEIRFCPFMAMREGVQVNCQSIDLPFVKGTGRLEGVQNRRYFSLDKGDYYHFNEIKIDLGPIERGELQGCEIVEVEE